MPTTAPLSPPQPAPTIIASILESSTPSINGKDDYNIFSRMVLEISVAAAAIAVVTIRHNRKDGCPLTSSKLKEQQEAKQELR